MPPINLWSLPRQDFFDSLWLRIDTKTQQRKTVKAVIKQPLDFMRNR